MPRETFVEKGRRYASEGRLVVTVVAGGGIAARCRGAGKVYDLGHHPERGWFCGCPARSECAHLHALKLVTAIPRESPNGRTP